MVTKISVQWSMFITRWSANTVLKYSYRKLTYFILSGIGGSPGKKKHSIVYSQSKDLTAGTGKLLCLLTFSILPD